jgi:hypothetical protein
MTTPPVRVERRVGQRFPYLLSVSLREPATSLEGAGFTQDLSSRGAFLFTDLPLTEGSDIELTLRMPSEITLGESMPVRCRGRVLRIIRPVNGKDGVPGAVQAESKIGVAVRLESYEYLPTSSESSANFTRISTLHPERRDDRPMAGRSARPLVE